MRLHLFERDKEHRDDRGEKPIVSILSKYLTISELTGLKQLSKPKFGSCEQITDQQLKQLEKYLLLAEKLVESQSSKSDSLKLLEIDYQFHHLIAESSGNQWLLTLLEQVFDKMALLRVQTTKHNPQVLEIRLEHREVYKAIALKNSDLA